jgi:hypothetical protein
MAAKTIELFPITDRHREMLNKLAGATMLPGSFDKRFVRNLQGATGLSKKQAELVETMAHRYRRQVGTSWPSAQPESQVP